MHNIYFLVKKLLIHLVTLVSINAREFINLYLNITVCMSCFDFEDYISKYKCMSVD